MKLGNKDIRERFTIPSGIVTTDVSVLERIANEIPEIGILTTKSISYNPKEGNREPIFAEYFPGCFTNAVGLTNPGAEEFAKKLSKIKIPNDKFLLTSIFGGNLEEFVATAEVLAPFSDGLELNLSCPHAEGYGQVIGQDKFLVSEIIATLAQKVDIPIFAKLSPNIPNIGEITRLCIESGAYGIVAINTLGPGYHTIDGYPVLTNKIGGLSGKGTLLIGLRCIKDISEAISKDTPIIACGGISNAQDIKNYESVGANLFGVGSALVSMSMEDLKGYFSELKKDLEKGTNNASTYLKNPLMQYNKQTIARKLDLTHDLSLIKFNTSIKAEGGQFAFLWIPGIGEKPFSILDDDPLSFLIQERGCFTKRILEGKEGDTIYIRGPYGQPIIEDHLTTSDLVLVGGGTGIAALYLIAKQCTERKNITAFLGAKDKDYLAYTKEFTSLGNIDINISTDNGSEGFKGTIIELLKKELYKQKIRTPTFYNCGPEKMIEAAIDVEKNYPRVSEIFYAYDHITKCGVGICGNCATKNGLRSCVDGPFLEV